VGTIPADLGRQAIDVNTVRATVFPLLSDRPEDFRVKPIRKITVAYVRGFQKRWPHNERAQDQP
jgi:hypothetical protein